MFYWKAKCLDGAYEDESTKEFDTKAEAYFDMRNAVLEKMKWNTEYDEDFEDDKDVIDYDVHFEFSKGEITHQSYSGIYIYEILEK